MKWIVRFGTGLLHRRPGVIWPWLYEPDKLKSWVSWLAEVRRDGSGPPSPGTRVVWVMMDQNNPSTKMEMDFVIEQAEPPHRLSVRYDSSQAFQGSATYTLIDRGDGSTELKSDGRYDFDNGFAKLFTPLIEWQAQRKLNTDFATLRRLVESR